MCGILGSIDHPFGKGTLDLLRHRGPDDSGIAREQVANRLVVLGHRRLSIVDPSPAGHQPMRTLCGGYRIVFNGEVYNHLDLRERTEGVSYRGHSDTETVLYHLARRGILSTRQFNGIFAFGLLDARQRKLFLARDAFGVKPLYYCADHESFLFSSELRALTALADRTVEHSHLAELLRLRYLPAPDTLFKGIQKVRPGHVVEVNLGGDRLTVSEYPFLEASPSEARVKNREEALDQYGFLLEQAVRRQLMGDVKIGVFLSGGVDSAMIAKVAQQHVPYRMKAFTVGFTGNEEVDEIADARDSATSMGLDHYDVRIGCGEFLSLMPRISAIVEEPLATTSIIPMFHLSELASMHGKVVLSGQGADEAMGGYRRYRFEVMKSCLPGRMIPFLAAGARLIGVRKDTVLRGLAAVGEPSDVRRFEAVYGVFTSAEIQRLIGHRPTRAGERSQYFYDLLGCSRRRHSAERMMAVDLRMGLADDLLLYTDKITMHHSIECRVPLLDLDLVCFVESLPLEYRVGLFGGKVLQRHYARRVLPAFLVRRRKKGFLSPTAGWFRNTNLLRDRLLDRSSRFSSYFSLSEVERVLSEHDTGINRERHIFLLLALHCWFEALESHDTPLHSDHVAAREASRC